MMLWLIAGLIGSAFMAIGLAVYISKSKKDKREIDKKISIAHISPGLQINFTSQFRG